MKSDKSRQRYIPPKWAWSLIRAFLDPNVEPTISARCKDAGIHRDTFYDALKKPEFVGWFKTMLHEAIITESSDVRVSHLRECLKGNLEAIKLWYEHYGKWVPTARILTEPEGQIEQLHRFLRGA